MRRLRIGTWIAATLAVPALLACTWGHAEVIRRDTQGGVLALQGARGAAWEDAETRMATHCGPGNYQVVAEEQVVVGQQTTTTGSSEAEAESEDEGEEATASERHSETTTTTDITEYRITYQCAGAAAPAPAPQPGEQPSSPRPKDEPKPEPGPKPDPAATSGGEQPPQ